jgi:hypothetical protein
MRLPDLSLLCVAALAACAPTTHVLVGQARPPTTPDQVTIFSFYPLEIGL